MKNINETGLDFIIDGLTNSIINVVTGDSLTTEITMINTADLKNINNKNGWLFDWVLEYNEPTKDVYKITITNNKNIIHGLISIEVKPDHVYIHLLESVNLIKAKIKCIPGFQEI